MSDYLRGWMQGRATVRNRAVRHARWLQGELMRQAGELAAMRERAEPNWRIDRQQQAVDLLQRGIRDAVWTARTAHHAWLKYRRWRERERAIDSLPLDVAHEVLEGRLTLDAALTCREGGPDA